MKNYEDFQDDDIVIDFANVKMTKRDFEEFYNYKIPVCLCSSLVVVLIEMKEFIKIKNSLILY